MAHQKVCDAIDDSWVDPKDLESGWDLAECWKNQSKGAPQPANKAFYNPLRDFRGKPGNWFYGATVRPVPEALFQPSASIP